MEIIKNKLRHWCGPFAASDIIEETDSVIVPDTNPDALQIICCRSSLNIQDKSFEDSKVKVTGNVNCCIGYVSAEGNKPYSVTASVPFSYSKEMKNTEETDRVIIHAKLLAVSASLVNPRKAAVKALVEVTYFLYKCNDGEFIADIKSDGHDGINCLRETVNLRTAADIAEKKIVLSDEIRLNNDSLDDSGFILKNDVSWICEDAKLLSNKVMIRGRADVYVTFIDEKGDFKGRNKYSIPFSQIIECDEATPEDEAEISFSPLRDEIELFTSSDGITTMTFALAAVTECKIVRSRSIEAVKDVFSTKWHMNCQKMILASENNNACASTSDIKENIPLDLQPEKIIGAWVIPENITVSKGESHGEVSFHVTVLCQDEGGEIAYTEKKIHADCSFDKPFVHDTLCIVKINEPSWELKGDEAEISFKTELYPVGEGMDKIEVISDCSTDKTKPIEKNIKASLVVRTMDKNDSVWNIAKAYNTSPDTIVSANKLGQEKTVSAGRLILIPFVNR